LETVRGEQRINAEQIAQFEEKLFNIRERLERREAIITQGDKVRVIAVAQGIGNRARFRGKVSEVRKKIETHFKDILATEEYDKSSFTELIDLINPILQDYIPVGHELLSEALQSKKKFLEEVERKLGLKEE
jgi:glutamine synthetase adenylyltransferase